MHQFKMIGQPGMYDDVYECNYCHQQFLVSADARDPRKDHNCVKRFNLYRGTDPEELCENSALYWALSQYMPIHGMHMSAHEMKSSDWGRRPKGVAFGPEELSIVNGYWTVPIVAEKMNRKFKVCGSLDEAKKFHKEMDNRSFLKSIVPKYTMRLEGEDFYGAIGDMVYSFEDGTLLMQELVEFENEMRFFVWNGRLAGYSHICAKDTPASKRSFNICQDLSLLNLAEFEVIPHMPYKNYTVDVAYIVTNNGYTSTSSIVEVNPFIPGVTGLYGVDILEMAKIIAEESGFKKPEVKDVGQEDSLQQNQDA